MFKKMANLSGVDGPSARSDSEMAEPRPSLMQQASAASDRSSRASQGCRGATSPPPAGVCSQWTAAGPVAPPAAAAGRSGFRWLSLFLTGAVGLTACQTVPPQKPADLTSPGWIIRRGQAVWRARPGAPELAGELLVATRANGDVFLEFSKPPLQVVVVQATAGAWSIQLATRRRSFRGRGVPPGRSVWLVLPRCLVGQAPPTGWTFQRKPQDGWHLSRASSGELLEGYLISP
jgi:hypothetical protein